MAAVASVVPSVWPTAHGGTGGVPQQEAEERLNITFDVWNQGDFTNKEPSDSWTWNCTLAECEDVSKVIDEAVVHFNLDFKTNLLVCARHRLTNRKRLKQWWRSLLLGTATRDIKVNVYNHPDEFFHHDRRVNLEILRQEEQMELETNIDNRE